MIDKLLLICEAEAETAAAESAVVAGKADAAAIKLEFKTLRKWSLLVRLLFQTSE